MERVLDLELEALYHFYLLMFDLKYSFLICKMLNQRNHF